MLRATRLVCVKQRGFEVVVSVLEMKLTLVKIADALCNPYITVKFHVL